MVYFKFNNAPSYVRIRRSVVLFEDDELRWYRETFFNKVVDHFKAFKQTERNVIKGDESK